MESIKKIIQKLREGVLREMFRELHWIYQYGLKYKGNIIWYMFFGVFSIASGLTGSIMSKYIIDAAMEYNSAHLVSMTLAYVILQLFTIGCRAWNSLISEKIVIKVEHEIRADIYDKIIDADWEALSQFHSGDLLNRIDNDVNNVSKNILNWVPDLFTRTLQFFGTLGIILYYDPTLALLALISAPITLLVSRSVSRRIRNYDKKIRTVSSDVMIFNEESFQNVELIKSFGLMESYKKKLRDVQETYKKLMLDYNRFHVAASSGMSFVGSVVAMICFGWGVYRLWTGHITYGTMTLFLQLATSLSGTFSALVYMVPGIISAATAAGRLMEITRLPKENNLYEDMAQELIRSNNGIEVQAKEISFQYNTGKKVLQKASFVARPGEIVAIVGPSGEGKTTMLRILLGLVSAFDGSVTVQTSDGIKIPVSAATRRLFSYVPQDNVMFAGNIAENMRVTREDATDEQINEALRKACAYEFVYKIPTGLNSPIRENGCGFSEGQIQRLAIARAILSDAPVLLMDEATSALDVVTERKILHNVLNGTKRKTCIITTHRPSVLGMCDRIYRITDSTMELMDMAAIEKMMMEFKYEC